MRIAERVVRCSLALLFMLVTTAALLPAREQKVIQKTSTDLQSRAADSWIDSASTTSNHGTDTSLRVTSSILGNQRSLITFDLSSISNSGIKVATLSLFMKTAPLLSQSLQARRMISLWKENEVTWANRQNSIAWTTAGGDANGTATSTANTGTASSVSLTWDLTADVQQWFGSASPVANYGTMIRNATENLAAAQTAIFSSKEDTTQANHPKLTLEFIQNVQGLTATAGNNQVVLSWQYPASLGTVISPANGVLILRQSGGSIASTIVPTDGTAYTRNAGCTNMIGAATIVFVSSSLPTSFNDSAAGDNSACPPANGTLYAYKVFTKDAANSYSASGASSQFVPYLAAQPGATASAQMATLWIAPTGATTLAAPGILPSNVVVIATNSNIAYGIEPTNGTPVFTPVSMDGAASGRPSVLDIPDSSIGTGVMYTVDDGGFVYAINSATGDLLWMTNPTSDTANAFVGGVGVFVKKFAGAGYTRASDLVVVGTRNSGTTTANQIVGLDGNDGSVAWSLVGASTGVPDMDIVSGTPLIDYVNSAVWVASHSNASTAANRPSLWKINPNISGTRLLATVSLNDISGSPSLTVPGDVLFVGNDSGTFYAVSTGISGTGASALASFATGDTRVVGEPLVLGNASPYTVIFSGATRVRAVTFNTGTNAFTTTGAGTWNIAMPGGCSPSSPIGFAGLGKVYVGCSDGAVYQIDLASGTIDASKSLRPGSTMGDPTLDTENNILIVGSTNSRVYAIKIPF